jgi:hypothetical protein
MQEKLDKFNAFIELFKQLPINIGIADNYSFAIKNKEFVEISTIENEWYGTLLNNVFQLTKLFDLQFFIDKRTANLIIH